MGVYDAKCCDGAVHFSEAMLMITMRRFGVFDDTLNLPIGESKW